MTRIPVERTIGDTYNFVFRNILSIFGIAWLPMLVMAAAIAGAVWMIAPDLRSIDWSAHADLAHNREIAAAIAGKAWSLLLPIEVLFYLLFAMIAVGIQRKALGLHEGPVFAFFSLGGDVWRLLGAMIFVCLLIALNGACMVAAGALVFWAGEHFNLPAMYGLVEFAAVIAGIGWFCYFAVRLMFFVAPAVVAEGGFGVARSWTLGRGNFWRIVVLFLACVLGPAVVISTAGNMIMMPFLMGSVMSLQHMADGGRAVPPEQAFAAMGQALRQLLPLFVVYEAITFPILTALSNGVGAFAYKGLTAPDQEAPA